MRRIKMPRFLNQALLGFTNKKIEVRQKFPLTKIGSIVFRKSWQMVPIHHDCRKQFTSSAIFSFYFASMVRMSFTFISHLLKMTRFYVALLSKIISKNCHQVFSSCFLTTKMIFILFIGK